MHSGSIAPYDLDLRVYMGTRPYPDWIRKQYKITPSGFSMWFGPDAALVTASPPFVAARQTALEATLDEFVIAAFVQQLSGQDLYVGIHLTLREDRSQTRWADQVWLGGTKQMDEDIGAYNPSNLMVWTSGGVPHSLLPSARIGCLPLAYQAEPY